MGNGSKPQKNASHSTIQLKPLTKSSTKIGGVLCLVPRLLPFGQAKEPMSESAVSLTTSSISFKAGPAPKKEGV